MIKVFLPLVFLSLSFIAFGQKSEQADLLQGLDNQPGSEKINTFLQLSEKFQSTDSDKAILFAMRAMNEADHVSDWEGKARAHHQLGQAYFSIHDLEKALDNFYKALDLWNGQGDLKGQAISSLFIGRAFMENHEMTEAKNLFVKALELAKEGDSKEHQAKALEYLGEIFYTEKIYGKALERFEQALQAWKNDKNEPEAARVATKLGKLLNSLGSHEEAISHFGAALFFHEKNKNKTEVANLKLAISESYLGLGMGEDALLFAENAYLLFSENKDSVGIGRALKDRGAAHLILGYREKAGSDFQKCVFFLQKLKDTPEKISILKTLALAQEGMGKPKEAFQTLLAFSDAHSANFDNEKSKALLELKTKYEVAHEVKAQQAEIEKLEMENADSRKTAIFLFVLLGLIFLLSLNLFFSYKRKKKDHRLLEQKNEEITAQKEEIENRKLELEAKNVSLDLLNKKLVTEISEREGIEKSSFARDRFLATMSHEMRTPLNTIIGMAHLLLEGNPRPDQTQQIRTLQFSANDLVVFINDVLDFSKIEAGKLNMEDRPFLPVGLFEELKSRFHPTAEKAGILFNFFHEPKIPASLWGDDARLMQIMSNLISDIFQHTEKGYVNVDVSAGERQGHHIWLKIRVEGTDGGHRRNLFEDAHSGLNDNQKLKGYSGHDFSLSITKRLVELQNGKMEVSYQKGEWTRFSLCLPFKINARAKENNVAGSLPKKNLLQGQRILLVEDNKINQLVVAKMLKNAGALVSTAKNGLIALETFEQMEFDLILMDVQMPVMDGYRTTAEIRRHPDEVKKATPIIALTASAFLAEKEKAVLFGMDDHVAKPFSPDELLEKIRACIATAEEAGSE